MSEIPYFTSEWEWQNINRGLDYTVSDGVSLKRNNWSLSRTRWSNMPYVSELDTTLFSITAYNGGVSETISGFSGATTPGVRFSASTPYTLSTTTWITTGNSVYGQSVYVQERGSTNIPSSTMTNVLSVMYISGTVLAPTVCWAIVETTEDLALSNSFPNTYSTYTNKAKASNVLSTALTDINGQVFLGSNTAGTFATATDTTAAVGSYPAAGEFLCTADNQVYNQNGISWYQQAQTWSFKDAWRIV